MEALSGQREKDKDLALIKRYLEFELDETERTAFEIRLVNDDAFALKMAEYQKVQSSIRETFATPDEQQKQALWASWMPEEAAKEPSRTTRYYWWGAIAAVLVLGFWVLAELSSSPDYKALAQAARQSGPELKYGALRSTESPENARFLLHGYDQLLTGNYSACIQHFANSNSGDPFYEDGRLIQSLAYQHQGELDAALQCLLPMVQDPAHSKFGMASWQASLLYLELGDAQKALETLQPITSPKYQVATNATDLLQHISNF